uniref:Myosinlike protein putative n=1 Tax=Albugo laibachii Nc14 TaxID=890382 RepID=F0WGD0_9STRA|nr:myosinlike protein putative [Albugo laibachii Nc14]|eukprot:CCA20290.1 myosinlike protein putative [Albugo laibachii Nc14]
MLKVGVMVEVNVGLNSSKSIPFDKHEGSWAPAVVIDRYMSPIDTNGAILVIEMEDTLEIKEFLVPEDPLQWIPELRPHSDENGHMQQSEADTAEQVEDLTNLKELDSFSILATLESRFQKKKIYTNTGSILLAINPFQALPSLYHSSQMTHYLAHFEALNTSAMSPSDNLARGSDSPASPTRLSAKGSKTLQPHIYQVAGEAFRAMRNPLTGRPTNQSILVSGESGSGKTESTKFLMEYLARAGDPQNRLSTISNRSSAMSTASTASMSTNLQASTSSTLASSKSSSASSYSLSIAAKVLQTNTLLESFGNARTLRNDNSSRFGKFIKLHFTQHGKLIGASIQTYLLEKVRLVSQTAQERNYHIFYEMMLGASEEEHKRWRLSPCLTASSTQKDKEAEAFASFRYLNQSGCVERRDGIQERKIYKKVTAAMYDIGFTPEEIQGTFDLLAALLHIGNLTFAHEDVGTMDASLTTDLSPQSVQSRDSAASLLSVDAHELEKALSARKIRAGSDFVSVKLSAEQANNARDAFAKSLYSRLFDWLVRKMNAFFKTDNVESHSSTRYIGILDIFGFEVFPQNSFEQLCINFANETLQQQFNEYVFKMEQKEYEAQGVEWKYVEYSDNQDVLNLISQRPTGILPLIDEECLMPKGNDTTLASKLYRELENHPRFSASRTQKAKGMFVVSHYAGDVEYSTSGFLDKNKDLLHQEAVDLFLNVPREGNFVRLLFEFGSAFSRVKSPPRSRASASKQRGASVCWQFKEQLSDLLETLRQTNPHYVRCLKPNDLCSPETYDRECVLHQLKCNGVMEAVRVARAGFPVRILHEEFLARYFSLRSDKKRRKSCTQSDADTRGLSANSLVVATVRDLLQDIWVVMIKPPIKGDEFASTCLAMGMQMGISKTFLKKEAYEQLESLRLQSIRKHMVVVYSSVLCNHARRRFLRLRQAIIVLQSVYRLRMYQAQNRARKRSIMNANASKLQSLIRMVKCRRRYRDFLQALRVLQCRYRLQKHRERQRSKEEPLQYQDSILASSESSMESFLLSNDVEGETSPLRASDFHDKNSDTFIAKMDANSRKSIRPLRSSRISRTFSDQPQELLSSSQISTKSSNLSDTILRTTRSSRAVALPRLDIVQQAQWINDDDRFGCHICNKRFSVFRRKHHCRACGEVICGTCSLHHRIQNRSTRICVSCVAFHSLDSPTSSMVHPGSTSTGLASISSQGSPFEVTDPSTDGLWINTWPEPPYPDNEPERLAVLRELNIRDLALSGKFNMYCEVAAKTMKCPIAYVSIVEETEQILVANIGMAHSVLPREMSFCAHTICQASVLVVLDTRSDGRFRENPMVKGEKGTVKMRYYAGATIFSVDGHALGTVAVFDTKPRREVDQDHIGMLQHLSFLASEKMMQSTIQDNGQML